MVSSDYEPKSTDGNGGCNHSAISKYRFAREDCKQMRSDAHAGQNGYVNFRMTEEPEEMLPQQNRSAVALDWLSADDQSRRNEESGSLITGEEQKHHRNRQNTQRD